MCGNDQLMFSRIALSLALTVAVLVAPIAPMEIAKAFSRHARCHPTTQMNIDPCQRCPMNSNQTNSNSGSTCCSVQAPCFVGYANTSDDFIPGTHSGALCDSFTNHVHSALTTSSGSAAASRILLNNRSARDQSRSRG